MRRPLFTAVITAVGLVLLAGDAAGQRSPRDGAPPKGSLHRVRRGQPLDPCPGLSRAAGSFARESRGQGFIVDSCGRKVSDAGEMLPAGAGKTVAAPLTIDLMTTSFSGSAAGGPITLMQFANIYSLSDGSSWSSGAGVATTHSAPLDHVEVSGTALRYVLSPPTGGLIYEQTDYDSGNHSAQGQLGLSGPLVIEAEAGATTAVVHGNALVVANDATYYGEPRFNYYTAMVGSVVPFQVTLTMQQGSTWTADTFSRPFTYSAAGSVDFAHPVSGPRAVSLAITGPSQIPAASTIQYVATVTYENGVQRNGSATASWTVDPPELASVTGGSLTTGTLATATADLTLRATFVQGADSLMAQKQVLCLANATAEKPGTWPMFQANARHTGYISTSVEPASFRLKWQQTVGTGLPLNPVAAGDGKVFVTLLTYFNNVPTFFALRASDGATLWSKSFGSVFSVNPPSYAYGNVYLQTGDSATDTWLYGFDGDTGNQMFKAPHGAQWERYFAPTIYDGKVYVNGGAYGGMYGFDAYSGDQLWFASNLPQYDQWTPAVDADRAYSYAGEYSPGLYAETRATGTPSFFVADPNFDWNGWSMDLAPVLGDHDDIIAIHNGRLISFDTASHTIRWEVVAQYAGQPSLAHDRIYAIDGGRLRVLDEITHAEIWSWQPAEGSLAGPMIVTDRHVFASTGVNVYAVDLTTRQPVWSYPVGGQLAIADNTLYVTGQDGKLTAFAGSPATSFYTVPPCRVLDTRSVSGGPALSAGIARTLHLAGQCGVPATAVAVSANVTVVQPASPGYLQIDATGVGALFSTLNYSLNQTRSNNAILALNPAGDVIALATQSAGSTVHVVIDVNGYFE
jgi:hypothetical protein